MVRTRADARALAVIVAVALPVLSLLLLSPRPTGARERFVRTERVDAGLRDAQVTATAVRVHLSWTAPAGGTVRSIEVLARRSSGVVSTLRAYADSTGDAPPRFAVPGAIQDAWVLVSEDWRAGGWMLASRSCNTAGCAHWSNWVVVLASAPDTLWHLERAAGPRMPSRDGVEWKRAAGLVGWSLQWGDSLTVATIVHQETVQLRELPSLCRIYGFFGMRGGFVPCP